MSKLLSFDGSAAIRPGVGLEVSEVASLGSTLDKLRDEICDIDEKMLAGEIAISPAKSPLLGAFYKLPERSLAAYEADRLASELARLLAVTKKLMTEVDRIVVLCDRDFCYGPKAVMQACCQPLFNELSRGQRGSRPRLYFAESFDNDHAQGLLYLLGGHRQTAGANVEDRWGLVIIGGSGTSQAAAAISPFLAALNVNCGFDQEQVRSRIIAVASPHSGLGERVTALGCSHVFDIPGGLGKLFSILSAAGLVPAALLGINIMKLQEGARAISEHFRGSKASENIVLQFAAVNYLMSTKNGGYARVMNLWNQALEATGWWYERLLLGCLDGAETIARPVSIVQESCVRPRNRRFLINVTAEKFRFDPLGIGSNLGLGAELAARAANTLVELQAARFTEFERELQAAGEPSAHLQLPQVDEYYLGQLMQLLMLATVVEARLLGLNPYQSALA